VCGVNEGLGQIDLAAITQILSERLEDLPEHTLADPLLHPAMARLIRRVLRRQRFPRRSGPQHPKHSVEHMAGWHSRTTFAVFARRAAWDQWLNNTPLLVGELHGLLDHAADRSSRFLQSDLKTDRTPATWRRRFRDAF
jgi:hypothetical protein